MPNYIKALQNDRDQLTIAKDRAHEAICDLAQYIQSGKFNCGNELDGYVSVDDVQRYLISIKEALNSTEDNLIL